MWGIGWIRGKIIQDGFIFLFFSQYLEEKKMQQQHKKGGFIVDKNPLLKNKEKVL